VGQADQLRTDLHRSRLHSLLQGGAGEVHRGGQGRAKGVVRRQYPEQSGSQSRDQCQQLPVGYLN